MLQRTVSSTFINSTSGKSPKSLPFLSFYLHLSPNHSCPTYPTKSHRFFDIVTTRMKNNIPATLHLDLWKHHQSCHDPPIEMTRSSAGSTH